MRHFDYQAAGRALRPDLEDAYRDTWSWVAAPGNWWTGAERVAIASEARLSHDCDLCDERAQSLSPMNVDGPCKGHTEATLPDRAVEAIHRISRDAARLSRKWLEACIDTDFTYGHYVELLGVLVMARSIDAFHRALGLELAPLPTPIPGQPSGYLPKEAGFAGAWVPVLNGGTLAEDDADIYAELPPEMVPVPNVLSALSLVPDNVRMLMRLSAAQYINMQGFLLFDELPGRVLSRTQVELVAARTSALNDCFY